jgi:threonine/homoserine/homoserine lactone efflux protein
VLTGLTAVGVSALVAGWPAALQGIRAAGVAYLLWMAWQAWHKPTGVLNLHQQRGSFARIARQAMVNSLFNPKPLLFFVMFLPQFASDSRGALAPQLLQLGLVLSLIALVFHTAIGVLGSVLVRQLKRPASRWPNRALAGVLTGLAAHLASLRLST